MNELVNRRRRRRRKRLNSCWKVVQIFFKKELKIWIYTHTSLFLLFFHSIKEPSNLTIVSQFGGCLRERERERWVVSFVLQQLLARLMNEWMDGWKPSLMMYTIQKVTNTIHQHKVMGSFSSKAWWIPLGKLLGIL